MFHFGLCRQLGIIHPDYLLRQLTVTQLAEWEAYEYLHPATESKMDIHMAYLQTLLVNLTIGVHSKKGTPMHKPIDYLIDWVKIHDKVEEQQSAKQMRDFLMSFAKEHNAKVKEQQLKN